VTEESGIAPANSLSQRAGGCSGFFFDQHIVILAVDLLPEDGAGSFSDHEALAQPHMLTVEHEGFRRFNAVLVAIEDIRANRLERNLFRRGCE